MLCTLSARVCAAADREQSRVVLIWPDAFLFTLNTDCQRVKPYRITC